MNTLLIVGAIIAVIGTILAFWLIIQKWDPTETATLPANIAMPPLAETTLQEIRELLARGNKIQAIKLVREQTNLGLGDAKNYVEALEAGRVPSGIAAVPLVQSVPDVQTLLMQGRKIEAIKLVREQMNLSLSDAKDYVEALEAGQVPSISVSNVQALGLADISPGLQSEVLDLVRRGNKIGAIKLLRDNSDLGLKEAKDYIDTLA